MGELRSTSGTPVTEIKDRSGRLLWSGNADGTDWFDSDLRNAVLDDIAADGGALGLTTTLIGASLKRSDFYWLFAFRADFTGADLEDCVFRGCQLSEANFSGAMLRRTRFVKDNLDGRTDLSGADLSAALIEAVDFSGAKYDDATKFPEGFDPSRHGLLKAEPES